VFKKDSFVRKKPLPLYLYRSSYVMMLYMINKGGVTMELDKKHSEHKALLSQLLGATVGALIYAAATNWFIVPAKLYSGGLFGVCQLIRTGLVSLLHLNTGNFDIAGIIYYCVNFPVLLISMRAIGKKFFWKTLFTTTLISFFLSVIPVVHVMDDMLSTCIVGGLVSGFGLGIMLRNGASAGGMDVIALLLIKWKKDFSVAKVGIGVNVVLYGICLFLFNAQTVIYSLICTAVCTVAEDRMHTQNINVLVTIITKSKDNSLEAAILKQLGRGVTTWGAHGAYTNEETRVLFCAVSKYEVRQLKSVIYAIDPQAFVVINEKVSIEGHFVKRLA